MDYNKLRGKIKECGLTETALARLLQISPSTLSMKLNNKLDWKLSEIQGICKALNIPGEELHKYFLTDQAPSGVWTAPPD